MIYILKIPADRRYPDPHPKRRTIRDGELP